MSNYLNVGARIDGRNAPSKRALKLTLQDHPERVTFYATASIFNGPQEFTGAAVPADLTLSVVGPDPYTSRRFYATVVKTAKGAVKLT